MIIDILKKNSKKLKLNSNKSIYIFIQFYYNIKKLNLFRHASISCKMQSILIKNIPGRSWILRICYDDTLKKMFKPYVFYKLKSASNVQQLIVANAESETDIYDVENGNSNSNHVKKWFNNNFNAKMFKLITLSIVEDVKFAEKMLDSFNRLAYDSNVHLNDISEEFQLD